MKSKYMEIERRAIKRRLDNLANQKQKLAKQVSDAYNLAITKREDKQLAENYYSLQFSYNKLLREMNSLKRRRAILNEDKKRIQHRRFESKSKSVGASLFVIFMLFAAMSYIQPGSFGVTGYATSATQTAVSTAIITKNVAIQANNLDTIEWSTELVPNTDDNAAEHNADGDGGVATYYISMAPNNSVDVDFCINATNLTSGVNTIALGNYTLSNSTTSSPPAAADSEAFTEDFVKQIEGVTSSQSVYYRFWLDIPAQQPAGTYTNTVTFKAIESGTSC